MFKDRENIDVIAHELAHSWSGNLVTSASWEHFWLNEGWTVYLERRVCIGNPVAFEDGILLTDVIRSWLHCEHTLLRHSMILLTEDHRHGEQYRHFSAIIGWKALSDAVNHFGSDHEFTRLVVDLKGKDPDDAFSSIPYEKGFNFLFYLENLVGKPKFDKFIPHVSTSCLVDSVGMQLTLLLVLHGFQGEITGLL